MVLRPQMLTRQFGFGENAGEGTELPVTSMPNHSPSRPRQATALCLTSRAGVRLHPPLCSVALVSLTQVHVWVRADSAMPNLSNLEREAVILGTKQRFRPILLTSLTTFLGVYPLIMETSLQAQFLIPLAVSIGYGVLFGTVIIVLTVPAIFMAQDYVSRGLRGIYAAVFAKPVPIDPTPDG